MWANRGEAAPCAICKIDPLPENKDAIKVFFKVNDQFIMGMGGPVALNHVAIDLAVGRALGVKCGDKFNSCFDKVVSLGHWWVSRIKDK